MKMIHLTMVLAKKVSISSDPANVLLSYPNACLSNICPMNMRSFFDCSKNAISYKAKKPLKTPVLRDFQGLYAPLVLGNYIPICFATSSAKFSSFFSIPSPVSKRTKPLIAIFALFALATSSTYFATDCFPSSAFTYT